jgi:RNA polymerase sigma-70 factor (ECF subfamily)
MGERDVALQSTSDASVIEASARRPERFARVFDRHFTAIHRYLARRAGREVADDLASLCFTVAFERRGTFDPLAGDARPWLYGIATNLLRDHWRAERRAAATVIQLSRHSDRDVEIPLADGDDPDLAAALGALDPPQLDVLLLYAWGELSYEEISGALGVPVGTVRSRLARARARVRAELESPSRETTVTQIERIGHERRP